MDSRSFPTTAQVRQAHPGELAVLLSTVPAEVVAGLSAEHAEAVVVATQRVASWCHGLQAVAVDRFAEHVLGAQEAHAAELVAARDEQRAQVESAGGRWRGDSAAVALPEPEQVAASMLAPELRISPRTMRTRLNRARSLLELPHTLALALHGELEPWRVDAVVVASQDVAADRLLELEARLYAADVSDLPKPRLVERVRRAALKADPEGMARGVARAPRRRSLRVGPSETAGLMRWSLEVPDDLSRRMLAAVDALAQEYLTADACSAGSAEGAWQERRGVEAARLDALGDLVMANAQVETVVELVVPVGSVGSDPGTVVTRPDTRAAVAGHLGGCRRRARSPGTGPAGSCRPGSLADDDVATAVDDDVVTAADDDVATAVDDGGEAAAVDDVTVDIVLGSVTRDTLAAGDLERELGLVLGMWLEVETNPFITSHGPPPAARPPAAEERTATPASGVWFVDGLVEAPGASSLLPQQVVGLLRDVDTRVRIRADQPGAADGDLTRRTTYRPGRALAATVRARDGHCRFPGCSVPAARCHLDHVVAFPGGETAESNLQALCPSHHGFKHHAAWRVAMTASGTCTWTAPNGRAHVTQPRSARDLAA